MKTIKLGKAKVKYHGELNKVIHVNLGTHKKGKDMDTVTIHNSIVDKEYGNLIGVQIAWDEKGYSEVWLDFDKCPKKSDS